jgi:hypothetical protein
MFCTDTTVVIKRMYLKTLCHLYHTFYSEASQSAYLRIQSITISHQRTHSCIDNNCIYSSMHIFLNKWSLIAACLHLTPQTVYLRIHPININHPYTHSCIDRYHIQAWLLLIYECICWWLTLTDFTQYIFTLLIWCEALTEGLGYVMWSRTVHSPRASYDTSSVRPRTTKHIPGDYSRAQLRSADETRVSEGTRRQSRSDTWFEPNRLVSVFSSGLYVAVSVMSHCATHVHGKATQDTFRMG